MLLIQKKSKARKEFQEFVVEGIKMVEEAPKDRIVKVYASETFLKSNKEYIDGLKLNDGQVEVVSDHIFLHMSDTQTPQGVMALVKMRKYGIDDIYGENALIIGIENLQDPGNLGTIVRMGEGAGVTGFVISSNPVDIYNPKTIRSTMGSIYRMPFVYADDFADEIRKLKENGVKVYAAHLKGKCRLHRSRLYKACCISYRK